MTQHDDPSSRAARSALLASGIAAAGAAALIFLPKVRRALADTIDLAEETARRWYGAAEDVADEFTARTAGRREAEPEPAAQPESEPEPASEPPPRPKAAAPKSAAKKTAPKAAAKKSAAKKSAAKAGTTKSTSPGHVNPRGQTVVRRVGKSPSWKGQYTYELECGSCGHHYGANGPDIDRADGGEGRACPSCQDGPAGDPI